MNEKKSDVPKARTRPKGTITGVGPEGEKRAAELLAEVERDLAEWNEGRDPTAPKD